MCAPSVKIHHTVHCTWALCLWYFNKNEHTHTHTRHIIEKLLKHKDKIFRTLEEKGPIIFKGAMVRFTVRLQQK